MSKATGEAIGRPGRRAWLGIICVVMVALGAAASARGATDPLFVFTPEPPPPPAPLVPPPSGYLDGPCGLAADSTGNFYVSDYYHHVVDVFSSGRIYQMQLANEDPTDGPCGLALDAGNRLYVNNFHRNVVKFNAPPFFGTGTVFPLPTEDEDHHLPTGVAVDPATGYVYVDNRTYISVYDSAGNPIEEAGEPLRIGQGSLEDGYGVAVSQFEGTLGCLYVPDAATNTVKVYNPLVSKANPIAALKDPFNKPFISLRDSAVAVDRITGTVYFVDNAQPNYTELPQATIYAYNSAGAYAGHLKYNVIDALPPGLAVDNSVQSSQGRVYVTSGNTDKASIYAYAPGSTVFGAPLPPLGSGLSAPGGGSSTQGGSAQSASASSDTSAPQATPSVITQEGNLRVTVDGKLSPKRLPREGAAPISVSVDWKIATVDGSPPPRLKTLGIEINREGRFDYAGLPTCPYAKIQPATTQRALSNCKDALVGRGNFSANIALRGQEAESYDTSGKLLVFNGENKGKPVLFAQIYSAHPFATSFVIVFTVKKLGHGAYGTALEATLPKALRSWGNLTGIEMRLSRRYGFKGTRHSYISAGCPAPKGFGLASFRLARTAFSFTGGTKLSSTVVGSCRVR